MYCVNSQIAYVFTLPNDIFKLLQLRVHLVGNISLLYYLRTRILSYLYVSARAQLRSRAGLG